MTYNHYARRRNVLTLALACARRVKSWLSRTPTWDQMMPTSGSSGRTRLQTSGRLDFDEGRYLQGDAHRQIDFIGSALDASQTRRYTEHGRREPCDSRAAIRADFVASYNWIATWANACSESAQIYGRPLESEQAQLALAIREVNAVTRRAIKEGIAGGKAIHGEAAEDETAEITCQSRRSSAAQRPSEH